MVEFIGAQPNMPAARATHGVSGEPATLAAEWGPGAQERKYTGAQDRTQVPSRRAPIGTAVFPGQPASGAHLRPEGLVPTVDH